MSRPKLNYKTLTKGVLFCAPFALFFAAVLCLVLWLNQALLTSPGVSDLYELLFTKTEGDGTITAEESVLIEAMENEGEYIEGEFQTPLYGSQWATMNVDGWEERDIPVYYGNSTEILHVGAAQAQYSRFSGQNGKVILSAHVNLHFFEIEDSVRRFEEGEEVLVTMDTLWGRYVYRVKEVVLFGHLDSTPLYPDEGKETLFFYTCYPRENSLAYKTQRIGLLCELEEGATWRDYAES